MSVFNGEAFLKQAIESILNQTFTDFEFIIINDGSNDNTLSIIQNYTDSRITLINNEINLGLITSLNKGVTLAKAPLIARMDADDIAFPDRLFNQYQYFQNNPNCNIIGGNYSIISKNKTISFNHNFSNGQLKTILLFSTCFMHPLVMFKKSSDSLYDENFKHVEDYELWTRLATKYEFGFCEQKLIIYRSHNQQISAQNNTIQLQKSSQIRQNYLTALGFKFTNEQLEIHNLIGNNNFITNKNTLILIENWLQNLINQNNKLNAISKIEFNTVILKFWLDSCGNTNLGLKAYQLFGNSKISKLNPIPFNTNLKLICKCIIRKFKK